MNYDLLILSPFEFENFSRDILQKKLSVFIESFTTGRDSGIDLRFTQDKNKKAIIQAKRYKDFNSLISNLKLEVEKVKSLNPKRYILTTTASLTPGNKDTIKDLFTPYIINTEDILGSNDLNNLLSTYADIEQKYYKLWLSSTNVLKKILHSKIVNQSAFELDEIKENVKLYVQNNSFPEALSILNEHRYVIISGIPGIGKTTLARVLILYLLSQNFEEFIFLNQTIDDGYEYFSEGKKQVFFFDDFLGKNFFENKHSVNDDNKIVKFISSIRKSNDKLLILSTREYILNQAKLTYEAFKISNIELAKCILDLSSYTNIIKAQIIYNHLIFANIPTQHLMNLLENEKYLTLVYHKNYNPRIIETVINQKIWEFCSPDQFSKAFVSYFDNPESVWLYAFENSLDKFSQYALIVLITMKTPALIEDWENALKEFIITNNYKFLLSFDSIKFHRAIRELENTFIKTNKDSYDKVVVDYQNPSIHDFLVNYLRNKKDLIQCLLESLIFTDQYFRIFTTNQTTNYFLKNILLDDENLINSAINRILKTYNTLTSNQILKARYTFENFGWIRDKSFKYDFLEKIYSDYANFNSDLEYLVYSEFQKIIYIDDQNYSEQKAYLDLLQALDINKLEFNEERLIDTFINNIESVDNLELLDDLKMIFTVTMNDTMQDHWFRNKIEKIVSNEIENIDGSEVSDFKDKVTSLQGQLNISLSGQLEELTNRELSYESYLDSQIKSYIEKPKENDFEENSESKVIAEIFNSLIYNS